MENAALRVLVVDDERTVRENLKAYLEDEGFLVRTAESGEAALALLTGEAFEVAIVDMRLPGIDGNAFILQAHQRCPELRFLIHTGSSSYSIPQSLHEIGLAETSVFRKPIVDMNRMIEAMLACRVAREVPHER